MYKINPKFYALPVEKQKRIINASLQIFSLNGYKNSVIGDIAKEADVSKSLLFHYFTNKEILYRFIYNYSLTKIMEVAKKFEISKGEDFFKLIERSNKLKIDFYREHPKLNEFFIKSYLDEDDVPKSLRNVELIKLLDNIEFNILDSIDVSKFKEGIDVKLLFNIVKMTFIGYSVEKNDMGVFDFEKALEDSKQILDFFKKSSYKEEYYGSN